MERRRDMRCQVVVNAVQPELTAQGFAVADRGKLDTVALSSSAGW